MDSTSDQQQPRDRRGSDSAPAEGRRSYDKVDAAIARLRLLIWAVAALAGMLAGALFWLGYRGIGPGARTDALEARMDRTDLREAYRDSVTNVRLSRLERYWATQTYQSCLSDGHASKDECLRLFADGLN